VSDTPPADPPANPPADPPKPPENVPDPPPVNPPSEPVGRDEFDGFRNEVMGTLTNITDTLARIADARPPADETPHSRSRPWTSWGSRRTETDELL
jgi:hypothetical protein